MKKIEINTAVVFQTILIIILLLLFQYPLAGFLDSILVTPVLSKIPQSWFSTILVIFICGILTYKFWNTKILARYLPVSTMLIAFYLAQRFNGYWTFHKVGTIQWIYLWDLFFLTIAFIYLKDYIKRNNETTIGKKNDSFWVEDAPLEDIDQDTFQRSHFAKALSDQIIKMQSERSFAIGVLGEYGSGKTSFINLILKHLEGKNVDIVAFNAWKSEKSENIQTDFFEHLSNELSGTENNLAALLNAYSRKLSRIDSSIQTFFKRVGLITQMISKIDTEADEYARINELLKTSKKKLVIVIDDMDRLYSSEVIEVLRLVRNTANFTNTFYLLAYEKSYIQNAIKEQLHISNRVPFMDKIIQMEVPLPKREQHDLVELVKQLLKNRIETSEIELLNRYVFKYGFNRNFEHTFHDIFRNARDVIKFLNSFMVSYSLFKNEILFDKLFLLEILKYKYPAFYERLYQHRDDFLALENAKKSYKEFYTLRQLKEIHPNIPPEENGVRYYLIKYLIEEKEHSDDIRLIKGLMMELFNNYNRSLRGPNSIVYPSSFERYFRFRLAASEFSEYEFKKAWHDGFTGLSKFLDEHNKKGLTRELVQRLFMVHTTNRSEFELLIKAIFHIGPTYLKLNKSFTFDYEGLIDLLWNFEGMPAQRFYKGKEKEYSDFLDAIFDKAPFPYLFHSRLIHEIINDGRRIPVNINALIDYQITYFCEYVNNKSLDATAVKLMWTIRTKNIYVDDSNNVRNEEYLFVEEVKPHILNFVRTHELTEFVKGSIKKEGGRGYTIYPAILDIFKESKFILYELVKADKTMDEKVKTEFLTFYRLLEKNGFQNLINFTFESELVPKSNNEE